MIEEIHQAFGGYPLPAAGWEIGTKKPSRFPKKVLNFWVVARNKACCY